MLADYDLRTLGKVCLTCKPQNFDELANAIGEDPEGFEAALRDQFPQAAAWVENRMISRESEALAAKLKEPGFAGDVDKIKTALNDLRLKIVVSCTTYFACEFFRPASLQPVIAVASAGKKPSVVRQPAVVKPKKIKKPEFSGDIPPEMVEGSVMSEIVQGWSSREYLDRRLMVFKKPAGGLFGCKGSVRDKYDEHAVVNGIVNMCTMREPVTPYWAALDAMSSLKSFKKADVITEAMARYPDCTDAEVQQSRIGIAFDVLKGHAKHPRKKNAGMAHMVDDHGGGQMSIRAREAEETLQYFDRDKARREEFGKAPTTVPKDEKGKPVKQVAVVVGSPR
tara:strand:+ start:2186 stop:3199 length:1014 start_codon:yes stop_codon:yes gene_type:complete